MAELTLLEVHLDDATFSADTPFGRGDAGGAAETGDDAASDEEPLSRSLALVAGLVTLVVLAVVVRRLIGGADEEITTGVDGTDTN
jgi:hypothetical protein